ncbi:MAG TPA: amidohydrolase/deacetylase family metallohydrolase [Methylomirabilota bacterium]
MAGAGRRTQGRAARLAAETPRYDLVLRGGRVIDPARDVDGCLDVAVRGGTIAAVAPAIAAPPGTRVIDVRGRLVVPGMIDTHAHVYQYVTGAFGMNPDLVGVRSGVTTVIDQGGASPLTIDGFRKFIAEPAKTRVYAFISNYLAGGLVGHRYVKLYGPDGINVGETVRAIERNRDLVKGIKCHAEVGGYSRWGIETLKLAKQAAREARVPVYIHLGRLWAEDDGTHIAPDTVMAEVVPLLDPGDILAHPFTKNPGAFVSDEGNVHPLIFEAIARGVRIDIGRGGHTSFAAARTVLEAGIRPFTVGADVHGYTIKRPVDAAWDAGYFDESGRARRSDAGRMLGGPVVFSLAQVMNELLGLGLALADVVAMVTKNAAIALGLREELGSLAPGRVADVSVIARDRGAWRLTDCLGSTIDITERLRPELCLRAGVVHQADSSLLRESTADVA